MSLPEKAKTEREIRDRNIHGECYACGAWETCSTKTEDCSSINLEQKWVPLETAQKYEDYAEIQRMSAEHNAKVAKELEAKIAEAQTLLGDAITELSKRHFTECVLKIRETQRCLAGEQTK